MAGYTPLFSSLTTGTLCGKWPDIGLWPIILSLADKNGVVDVTPQYLAGVTGLPVDEIEACMARFCAPDKYSRSSDYDGARLRLIAPESRGWGWVVVNHRKYAEKARKSAYDADRVASGEDAARKRHERANSRAVPTRPALSRAIPLSDSDADASKRHDKPTRSARGSRLPDDFKPDAEYATQQIPDIDADGEAQRFRDYWQAKAGASAVKSDWQATWRNWIRNCRDSGRYARRASAAVGVVMR